jgi:hypothetical protein
MDMNRKILEEGVEPTDRGTKNKLPHKGKPSPVARGTMTLERWHQEVEQHHRALLLYAMQHPHTNPNLGRSKAAVCRAVGVSNTALAIWAKKFLWEGRIEAYVDCESSAFAIYRKLYMQDYGRSELPHVAERMVIPINWNEKANATPDGTSADEVITIAKAHAEQALNIEKAAVAAINERRRKEREKVESFRSLVDMSLLEAGRLLKERRLALSAKDIKPLLEARQELSSWLAQQDDRQMDQRIGVESARMRHARDTNGDLVEAMWQDLEEIRTILGTLRTKRDSQEEMVLNSYSDLKRRAEQEEPLPTAPEVIDVIESE